jgi:thiamine pyrophosphokinase
MDKSAVSTILLLAGDRPRGFAKEMLLELCAVHPRPYVIAVDGGAVYADELHLRPDIIIGDGDSCPEGLFADAEHLVFAREKNFSDGQAAFAYALEHAKGKIAVFAALGGRVDHLLVNLFLPVFWPEQIERFCFFGNDCYLTYSKGYVEIDGAEGDLVSIFPLSPQVRGITLANMAYPLQEYTLIQGSSRCLSNIMTSNKAIINHKEGMILIVRFPMNVKGVVNEGDEFCF